MSPAKVRIIDLGGHRDFQDSASFVESLIRSLTARRREARPLCDIEVVRSRDRWILQAAIDQPATVIHIMAHGVRTGGSAAFTDEDGTVSVELGWLLEQFEENRSGVEAPVILADACETATPAFMKVIRDCLQEATVYIGTERSIDWWESTTFVSAFYASLFESKVRPSEVLQRGRDAGRRANRAFRSLISEASPFTVDLLQPSKWAQETYKQRWG